ncbi:MAG: 5' nucleotidase, NT5C type [bacterium]
MIAIDMDNTINDFTVRYIQYAKEVLGLECNFNAHEYMYDLSKYFVLENSNETSSDIKNKIFSDYNFWIKIPPKEEAQYFLQKYWCDDFRIVTYPWKFKQSVIDAKRDWITKYFPFVKKDRILFSEKKWTLNNIDVIIDDNPEILIKCFEKKITTIKYNYPYNVDINSTFEINDWKEMLYLI